MKFSSTLPIALALATGIAGAAAAQTTAAPGAAGASPQSTAPQASSSYGQQPQASAARQEPTNGAPSNATAQAQQSAPGLATNGNPTVRQAQLRLHAMGLYNGPTDGIMDPNTSAAIARFQQQRGLQRTEDLNPQTMAALNGSQTAGFGGSSAPKGSPPAAGAGGNTGPMMQR